MKQTKLDLYKDYLTLQTLWGLVINHDGNESIIIPELVNIRKTVDKEVTAIPRSCPTMIYMRERISESPLLQKALKC